MKNTEMNVSQVVSSFSPGSILPALLDFIVRNVPNTVSKGSLSHLSEHPTNSFDTPIFLDFKDNSSDETAFYVSLKVFFAVKGSDVTCHTLINAVDLLRKDSGSFISTLKNMYEIGMFAKEIENKFASLTDDEDPLSRRVLKVGEKPSVPPVSGFVGTGEDVNNAAIQVILGLAERKNMRKLTQKILPRNRFTLPNGTYEANDKNGSTYRLVLKEHNYASLQRLEDWK